MPAPTVTPLPTPYPNRATMEAAAYVAASDARMAAENQFGQEIQAVGDYVETRAAEMDESIEGGLDELTTILGAAGFIGTSVTSLSIGSGTKSFETQPDLSFRDGSWGLLTDTANAANFMWGQMTYDASTGDATVAVPANGFGGSGTKTSWRLTLTGPPGQSISLASVAEALAANSGKAVTASVLFGMSAAVPLTDAATVAWDTSNGINAYVILGGNRTIGAPTNLKSGVTYSLELAQDATGSRTAAWDSIWDFGVNGTPLLQTGASKSDEVTARYNARRGKLIAAFRKGA